MVRRGKIGLFVVAVLVTVPGPTAAQTDTGRRVLDYCLARPDRCALSVRHLTAGWERHWNGDRLEPSGVSDLRLLLAFVEATRDGSLDAGKRVALAEWGKTWVGLDRGALYRAFKRLGNPEDISLDELALVMVADGDRAARDLLRDLMGAAGEGRARRLWPGFHDPVVPYASSRALWAGTPEEPVSARRLLGDRSGVGALGYRDEVTAMTAVLQDPARVGAMREFLCTSLPWEDAPDACVPGTRTSPRQNHALARSFVPETTTRACSAVMAALLQGVGTVGPLAATVSRHLETDLRASSLLQGTFSRLGIVPWDIVPVDAGDARVASFAFFLQATSGGAQVAGCVSASEAPGAVIGNLFEFAEAVLLDATFAAEVQARLPVTTALPDLAPRVVKMKHRVRRSGDKIVLVVDVVNGGAATAAATTRAQVWSSDDRALSDDDTMIQERPVSPIGAGLKKRVRLRGTRLQALRGRFLIITVDADDLVGEADEINNIVFDRVQP